MELPPELKELAPYVQRAKEVEKDHPVVAYYAYWHAVTLGKPHMSESKATLTYLNHLVDNIEQLRTDISQSGQSKLIGSDEENKALGRAHVEEFAFKVFLNADNEDREGNATRRTARTFLAASVFLSVLKEFGDIDSEVETKIKYAKWKAVDILKAIKEGRAPQAGPSFEEGGLQGNLSPSSSTPRLDSSKPSTDIPSISEFPHPPMDFSAPITTAASTSSSPLTPPTVPAATRSAVDSVSNSLPATPSPTTSTSDQAPLARPATSSPVIPVVHKAPIIAATTPDLPTSSPHGNVDTMIQSAQKHARYAISALNYDDFMTARTNLLAALNDLGYNQQNNFGEN